LPEITAETRTIKDRYVNLESETQSGDLHSPHPLIMNDTPVKASLHCQYWTRRCQGCLACIKPRFSQQWRNPFTLPTLDRTFYLVLTRH